MALLIIAGASGCGKKFVLDKLKALLMPATDIKKYTTLSQPEKKEHIKSDLIYGKERSYIEHKCGDFSYEYEGELYGIPKEDIDHALASENNTIIIVRDYEIIKKIEKIYRQTLKVYVFTGPSGQELTERLEKLSMKDKLSPEERLEREKKDYAKKTQTIGDIKFDAYIENNFDFSINQQIQKVVKMWPYAKYYQLFVALPFSAYESEDFIYNPAFIRNTMEALTNRLRESINSKIDIKIGDSPEEGYNATYGINERIYKLIGESHIVICDLSVDNPNVFYEYRKAQKDGKHVITIASRNSYGFKKKGEQSLDIIYSQESQGELLDKLFDKISEIYGKVD